MPLILLGGINELDTVDGALAGGFEFVAMARALLRDPALVSRFPQRDRDGRSVRALHEMHADGVQRHPAASSALRPDPRVCDAGARDEAAVRRHRPSIGKG